MIPQRQKTPPTPPPANQASTTKVSFAKIPPARGHRILIYGTGGIGKTTLSCLAPGPVAMLDIEESLSVLRGQLAEQGIDEPALVPCPDWKTGRDNLKASGYDGIKTIVADSVTRLEEMCIAHTLKTVKHPDKNAFVEKIEDYGYGKGYQYNFDTFLPLLADLDRHIREGRNVILIAHECTSSVPNPRGDDWIRYEPRLQNPASGKASIRYRIKEWADHVLFLGYDVAVDKEGKAAGSGTRTLYCSEQPFCMGKSRTRADHIDIELGVSPWDLIIK